MSTADQIAEFIFLWDKLQHIQLPDVPQFCGAYCSFNSKAIWHASAEGKQKVFAWLLVQNRILTADLLMTRSWPCHLVCILCDQDLETAGHLRLHCVYSREVWFSVTSWADITIQMPMLTLSTEEWWNEAMRGRPKQVARRVAGILMCTTWNLWKERNRRIFQGTVFKTATVVQMIKDELQLRATALGARVLWFIHDTSS
jgi:hypothetical protein